MSDSAPPASTPSAPPASIGASTYVLLVGSMLIWGGTWVSGRIVAAEMTPLSAAFLRFAVASVFLLLLTTRMEGRFTWPRRDQWLPLTLLGASGVATYNVLFFLGLQTVPAGRAALIIACIPAVLALVSGLFLGERLGRVRALGIPLSLAGVLVILSRGRPETLFTGGVSLGDGCILGCVAAWSVYSLLGKRCMTGMSPLFAVSWSCILGDAMLLPLALAEGLVIQVGSASGVVWANLLYLGVLATGLAFYWYYLGIRSLGASRAGVFINLVPVAAITLGALILDEPLTLSMAVGGVMVVSGVWLTNR